MGHTIVAVLLATGALIPPTSRAGSCAVSDGVTAYGSVVIGTAGDDVIDCSGASSGHFIMGLAGDDLIIGSDLAPDVIVPGDGLDTVRGGDGLGDLIDFIPVPRPVVVTTSGATDDGYGRDETGRYAGIEDLVGSPFADSLTGDSGANMLRGGAGDDVLVGGLGPDVLDGGAGIDVASFAAAGGGVAVDLSLGSARGDGDDIILMMEALLGTRFDDVLRGSMGRDHLSGGAGVDLLDGRGGADDLDGGRGPDTLLGGPGHDALQGGYGTDACAVGSGGGAKVRCEARPMGETQGVVLFQLSWSLVGVGFHESLFATALPIRPDGPLLRNENPARFTPPRAADGLPYVVMASRGRAAAATTSADVVVGSRTPVLSPVTGRVALVRRYLLYCEAGDWQVIIRPDARPDLLLMVLHTTDIRVQEGDRVIAAVTRIGTSWGNDMPSAEENIYFPSPYPHVHIEVEDSSTAPVPGCL